VHEKLGLGTIHASVRTKSIRASGPAGFLIEQAMGCLALDYVPSDLDRFGLFRHGGPQPSLVCGGAQDHLGG